MYYDAVCVCTIFCYGNGQLLAADLAAVVIVSIDKWGHVHGRHSSLCHDNMFIYSRRISFGCEASFDDVIVYKL